MTTHHVVPMRTLGLLGGMSSVATGEYYRRLNQAVNTLRGGHAAAELLMYSVNFENIEAFVRGDSWPEAAAYLVDKARRLERGGAEVLMLGTNTMHRVAPQIEAAVSIPLLHIVDVTAEAARSVGVRTVGVLGTRPVMEAAFYQERFASFGIEVITPRADDRTLVDRVIFDELVRHVISPASRAEYVRIMTEFVARGAEAIVLGCTEIDLLVTASDFPEVPLLDTTALHVERAVRFSLGLEKLPAPAPAHSSTAH